MKKTLHTLLLALLIIPTTGISLVSCSDDASESVSPQISREEARAQLEKKGIKKKQYDNALFSAALKGDCDLVQLLIIAGADVNKRHVLSSGEYSTSYTPLSIAISSGSSSPSAKRMVVKNLLAVPDINPNVTIDTENDSISILEFAERQGMTEIADMLRAAGAE